MDLRRLEVFSKLMAVRSFSRTAEELGLTQPTVSGHIKTLEEEIGLRLFDRYGRKVLPTSAAVVLLEYAQRMLELRVEAEYALDQFKGKMSGRLKLGGSTIPGGYILPVMISGFRKKYPEARLNLVLGDTQAIVNRVMGGEIEIGVVGARVAYDELEYTPLVQDEMVLVMQPDHPWAENHAPISVRDLASVPFVIREKGSGTRTAMLAALGAHQMGVNDLNVVAEMGSTESVLQGVKAGLGVSILSRLALAEEVRFHLVKVVPIPDLDLCRKFFVVAHKKRTRSPLCQTFLEYLISEGPNTVKAITEY